MAESAFSSMLDPSGENPYFAVDVQYKFMGAYRALLIQQARLHPIVTKASRPNAACTN